MMSSVGAVLVSTRIMRSRWAIRWRDKLLFHRREATSLLEDRRLTSQGMMVLILQQGRILLSTMEAQLELKPWLLPTWKKLISQGEMVLKTAKSTRGKALITRNPSRPKEELSVPWKSSKKKKAWRNRRTQHPTPFELDQPSWAA